MVQVVNQVVAIGGGVKCLLCRTRKVIVIGSFESFVIPKCDTIVTTLFENLSEHSSLQG
jgi:hypothetical protein